MSETSKLLEESHAGRAEGLAASDAGSAETVVVIDAGCEPAEPAASSGAGTCSDAAAGCLSELQSPSASGGSARVGAGQEEAEPLVPRSAGGSSGECSRDGDAGEVELGAMHEDSPKATAECRICQEEDVVANLDAPCACAGSLKYAHQACLQHWCNEKRNLICEICHKPYKSTYVVPEPSAQDQPGNNVLSIEIREEVAPDGTSSRVLTLRDTVTGEVTRFDLSEPEEPQDHLFCCKSFVIILLMLMFFPRVMLELGDADANGGMVDVLVVFLRLVGIFLPLVILFRVATVLNERRREQEASNTEAAEAAAQVAFLLHARHAQLFARSTGDVQVAPAGATSSSVPPVVQGVV